MYFIRWTDGHVERGAQILVSIGAWAEDSEASDRASFGLECRIGDDRPGFMLVDAADLPWSEPFLGEKLARSAALADARKPEVFEILDRLVEADPRFRAFLVGGA